ncbi:DUF418 domain-containing protein [Melittangium boletus]|uniref:Transporter n=1 Tax=Melittangium boletus DSM 14713 TaxID=1294270 RepID=A0A286SGF8_9BACT|nr:DUF418 domain-containing protein [Melittangium boletus]ATB26598.1 transporter [Melittangium boletus DSM 14713]
MPESSPARPVDAGERVLLLDVLRGFALGGVFVSNAYMHLSGNGLLPRERGQALKASWWDATADFLFEQLLAGKAMALFSFLFGLGFAVQLGRAEARGASIVRVYSRRLGVLLLIGLLHRFALWYGDVLAMYAVTGFALLLFRGLPHRNLLVWGLALIFGGSLAVSAVLKLVPLWASSPDVVRDFAQENMAHSRLIRAQTLAAFQSGDYLTMARANLDFSLSFTFRPLQVSHMLVTLGRFLLGLLAGRLLLFQDVERHRPLFRRLFGWGLGAALVGSVAGWLIPRLLKSGTLPSSLNLPWRVIQPSIWELSVLGLAAVYAAGLSLLFVRPRWRRGLSLLAPAGQMALTNYLSQTVISQFVFYGYGFSLMGKLGAASCLALMSGLFAVQVPLSHLWMARFRFGPVEWLWRTLTYGQRQPMRRPSKHPTRDMAPTA